MHPNKILLLTWPLVGAFALPFTGNATRTIAPRDPPSNLPSIAAGFSARQTQQIMDGIMDAFELASYTRTVDAGTVDPIFAKWFNTGDRATVDGKIPASHDRPILIEGSGHGCHSRW